MLKISLRIQKMVFEETIWQFNLDAWIRIKYHVGD